MDNVILFKSQYRLKQWKERIQACKNSSMKVNVWCEHNNINISTYYYWYRKLRGQPYENLSDIKKGEDQTPRKETTLVFHSGNVTVEIPEGTSQEMITVVIQALRKLR